MTVLVRGDFSLVSARIWIVEVVDSPDSWSSKSVSVEFSVFRGQILKLQQIVSTFVVQRRMKAHGTPASVLCSDVVPVKIVEIVDFRMIADRPNFPSRSGVFGKLQTAVFHFLDFVVEMIGEDLPRCFSESSFAVTLARNVARVSVTDYGKLASGIHAEFVVGNSRTFRRLAEILEVASNWNSGLNRRSPTHFTTSGILAISIQNRNLLLVGSSQVIWIERHLFFFSFAFCQFLKRLLLLILLLFLPRIKLS